MSDHTEPIEGCEVEHTDSETESTQGKDGQTDMGENESDESDCEHDEEAEYEVEEEEEPNEIRIVINFGVNLSEDM